MSIVLAVLVIGIIILAHEFGHFLLAKRNGIGVVEFSVGMGPRLFSFQKGETRYSLKLIPFGGSCMMVGEDGGMDSQDEQEPLFPPEKDFNSKPIWARISVIAAGPIFNFLLAFLLAIIVIGNAGVNPAKVYYVGEGTSAEAAGLQNGDKIISIDGKHIAIGRDIALMLIADSFEGRETIPVVYERDGKRETLQINPNKTAYMMGISYYNTEDPAEITITVGAPGDTASAAGLKNGDIITSINGTPIGSGTELEQYFAANPLDGSEIKVGYTHNGSQKETVFAPVERTVTELGFEASYYREKAGFGGIMKGAVTEVRYWIEYCLKALKMLVTGQISMREMSGPVGIVDQVDNLVEETKSDGISMVILNLMNFAIMLSANLGVMNLLPLPALDGGRLVFLFIEAVRGKPVPREKEGMVHTVGLILLMVLMVFVLFNDIMKLF